MNRVITRRDVTFDEKTFFDGNFEKMSQEVQKLTTDDIAKLLQAETNEAILENPDVSDDTIEATQMWHADLTPPQGNYEETTGTSLADHAGNTLQSIESPQDLPIYPNTRSEFLPTPPDSPPSCLLASCFTGYKDETQEDRTQAEGTYIRQPWEHHFLAGITAIPKEDNPEELTDRYRATRKGQITDALSQITLTRPQVRGRIENNQKFLLSEIERPPKNFQDYRSHSLREEFKQAEEDHLASHALAHTWDVVDKSEVDKGKQIFDCMWVYTYKSDPQGNWLRCKARLVARGDQQSKHDCGDTYAATVAIRSFRIITALAARFDLEMKQYDAVNAYTNAVLPKPEYMRMPKGYVQKGCVLKLRKALYGLRTSAKLWQKTFNEAFVNIGYEAIPDEPCVLIKDGQITMYHVDDFIMTHPQHKAAAAEDTINQIQNKFTITGGDDISWYLGIQIIRDRPNKRSWLSQQAYCKKIFKQTRREETD